LLALLGALRREDGQEAVEVLDLRGCQDHALLLCAAASQVDADVRRVCAGGRPGGMGRTPYAVRTRSCSKAQSVAAARLRTPAFSYTCWTWFPTVFAEIWRSSAISWLDLPRTSTRRISNSRSVSPDGSSRGRCATRWPAAARTASTASGSSRPSWASCSNSASAAGASRGALYGRASRIAA